MPLTKQQRAMATAIAVDYGYRYSHVHIPGSSDDDAIGVSWEWMDAKNHKRVSMIRRALERDARG